MEQIPSDVKLYRMEMLKGEIQWNWLTNYELEDYLKNAPIVTHRAATKEEEELYDEAYRDGHDVAFLKQLDESFDGITFRMEGIEDGQIKTTKMFQCAICDQHKDFLGEVATAGAMYLGLIRDDKLWHLCYDCAIGNADVDWIKHGWVWDEDES
jgi:hypothetical protein